MRIGLIRTLERRKKKPLDLSKASVAEIISDQYLRELSHYMETPLLQKNNQQKQGF